MWFTLLAGHNGKNSTTAKKISGSRLRPKLCVNPAKEDVTLSKLLRMHWPEVNVTPAGGGEDGKSSCNRHPLGFLREEAAMGIYSLRLPPAQDLALLFLPLQRNLRS